MSTLSGPAPGWTRLPRVIRASLARPSIGDLTCVNSRFSAAEFFAASAEASRRSTLIGGSLLDELARGDRVLGTQLFRPIQFDLRKFLLRLHAHDLGGGAIEIRLIWTGIDYIKQIIFLDDCASLKPDLSNITGHAWPNLNRLDRLKASGELIPFVYLFLDRGNDVDR